MVVRLRRLVAEPAFGLFAPTNGRCAYTQMSQFDFLAVRVVVKLLVEGGCRQRVRAAVRVDGQRIPAIGLIASVRCDRTTKSR